MRNNEVLITRIIDAPRELVFKAWTDPAQLLRWYAPDGCSISYKLCDIRTGGQFHSCIKDPVYGDCWVTGTYLEVLPLERIVQTMAMADEEGNKVTSTNAGKDNDWPEETVLTVTFDDLGDKTKITLHQTVDEEIAKRTGAYPSWIKMLDRLSNELTGKPTQLI